MIEDEESMVTLAELAVILRKYFNEDPLDVASLMIWGAPGLGKSWVLRQEADRAFGDQGDDRDKYFRDIRLTLADPTRLMGMPAIRGDTAVWLPPSDVPSYSRKDEFYNKGVLALEELPSAAPAVQVTAHRLVHDRRIEETKLLDGWFIIALGNRRSDNALVYEMKSPLANRFMAHIVVKPDIDAWKVWAFQNNIAPEIISFLSWKPNLLLDMKVAAESEAWPSPRSWEYCSKILRIYTDNRKLLKIMVRDCIGKGPAAEFWGYLGVYKDLPDPKDILLGKEKLPKDTRSEVLWALTGAVVSIFAEDPKAYASPVMSLVNKMTPEFATLLIRDLLKIHGAETVLRKTKEFPEFIKSHQDFYI